MTPEEKGQAMKDRYCNYRGYFFDLSWIEQQTESTFIKLHRIEAVVVKDEIEHQILMVEQAIHFNPANPYGEAEALMFRLLADCRKWVDEQHPIDAPATSLHESLWRPRTASQG